VLAAGFLLGAAAVGVSWWIGRGRWDARDERMLRRYLADAGKGRG
jgi:hypothetical protein